MRRRAATALGLLVIAALGPGCPPGEDATTDDSGQEDLWFDEDDDEDEDDVVVDINESELLEVTPLPGSVPWPFEPQGESRQLGTRHAQYIKLDGWASAEAHRGVDVLVPEGSMAVAIHDGYLVRVKHEGSPNIGVIVGQPVSGGEGVLYWHIEPLAAVGSGATPVKKGDPLGQIVRWDDQESFTHLHMERVRDASPEGFAPWSTYESLPSAFSELNPLSDDVAPEIGDTIGAIRFFRAGGTTGLPANRLSGEVDVVVEVHDLAQPEHTFRLVPYRFVVELREPGGGQATRPPARSLELQGVFEDPRAVADDLYWHESEGLLSPDRRFFVIVTNTVKDELLDDPDAPGIWSADGAWDTTLVDDGDYELTVRVSDLAGHEATKTVEVSIENDD